MEKIKLKILLSCDACGDGLEADDVDQILCKRCRGIVETHVYVCAKKGCPEVGKELKSSMSPKAYRAATGSFMSCPSCDQTLFWRRKE